MEFGRTETAETSRRELRKTGIAGIYEYVYPNTRRTSGRFKVVFSDVSGRQRYRSFHSIERAARFRERAVGLVQLRKEEILGEKAIDAATGKLNGTLLVPIAAYDTVRLGERGSQIAAGLRDLVPGASPADEPAILLLATVLARIEQAHEYLDRVGLLGKSGVVRPIAKHVTAWETNATRLMTQLGLTPTSRASLVLTLRRAERLAPEDA